jgi:hypothetical protein
LQLLGLLGHLGHEGGALQAGLACAGAGALLLALLPLLTTTKTATLLNNYYRLVLAWNTNRKLFYF